MSRALIILLVLNLSATHAQAQKVISNQTHGWLMYFGNHKLADKVTLHTEYQWRRADVISKDQQSLYRLGVDYKFKDNVTLTAGYAYIVTHPYGEQPVPDKFHEHRIWQTVTVTQRVGIVHLNHRYRLEQRWLENRVKNSAGEFESDGYTYRDRIRYRIMATVSLTKKNLDPGCLFASAYDEVFVQFGKNFDRNYLDQNRISVTIGYVINANCNIQVGYLNQYIIKGDGLKTESNHTMQVSIMYNVDVWKKQSR